MSCLQKGYPLRCPSTSTAASCATSLIGYYSGTDSASCCSNITGTLLQGLQPDVMPSCNATPYSLTARSPVGAAPLPYVSSNGQPLQYIIPQMNFSCDGCLQQMLNITLMGGVSADSSFYLQLWRRYTAISGQSPVSSNLYQLNTSVLLTISASAVSSSNVYSLAINVCFHEGDTIGIQLPYNSLLRIATDNSSVIYKRDIPAQCTNVVSGIFQPSLNYTGRPLIALVTVPTPTPSLSTSLATPPFGSSLQYIFPSSTASLGGTVQPTSTVVPSQPPIQLIAAASTGAGVLLLVVLTTNAVAASVVSLIVCRRRKNNGPYSALLHHLHVEHRNPISTSENVVYQVVTNQDSAIEHRNPIATSENVVYQVVTNQNSAIEHRNPIATSENVVYQVVTNQDSAIEHRNPIATSENVVYQVVTNQDSAIEHWNPIATSENVVYQVVTNQNSAIEHRNPIATSEKVTYQAVTNV